MVQSERWRWMKVKGYLVIAAAVSLAALGLSARGARGQSSGPLIEAGELLGRPTSSSAALHMLFEPEVEAYVEYGTQSGDYAQSTSPSASTEGIFETNIAGLSAGTRYFYRVRFRDESSGGSYEAGNEYSFVTARPAGSEFTFTVTSDSHQGYAAFYNAELWGVALANVAADQSDFHFDLGDTFSLDDNTETQSSVRQKYLNQRFFFDIVAHSSPLFLVLGNHENEEGWNLDDKGQDVANSLPVLGANARKRYFANPVPNSFYTGNLDDSVSEITGDHLKEDYYAFEWGDALFVALDPFWYTMTKPFAGSLGGEQNDETVGDRWDWTLGDEQYFWLSNTLQGSDAKYKFVFIHHLTGGTADYSRGGANGAKFCEWGGYNIDGQTWGFDQERPGWDLPIHELMVQNDVDILFHGHDHVFAAEMLDGMVYQLVPHPANDDYGAGFGSNQSDYAGGDLINNSGHLRVHVTPEQAEVEYVRAFLPNQNPNQQNGRVDYSYVIEGAPPQANEDPQTQADEATLSEDGTALIDVLENDGDPEGASLLLLSVSQPSVGSAQIVGNQIQFTPPADFCTNGAPLTLSYVAGDGAGGTATGQVQVTVTCVFDDPVAGADQYSLLTGESASFAVLENDYDADGDLSESSLSLSSHPSFGTASVLGSTLFYTPEDGFTGSDSLTYSICDARGACDFATVSISVFATPAGVFEVVEGSVGHDPATFSLSNYFIDPVVVCSANYQNNDQPFVVRVSDVKSDEFTAFLQNPSALSLVAEQVTCLVAEQGAWTVDGVSFEAFKFETSLVDHDGSWVASERSYQNSYQAPVVLGQVMSAQDADWSVFWSRGATRQQPPSASQLSVGLTVCEDSDITRAPETVGYIVTESAHGVFLGREYEASLGPASIQGIDNSPPDSYSLLEPFATVGSQVVVTQAGMSGSNGGWAQTHGAEPFSFESLALSIDEDQIADSERVHIAESVAYFAFGEAAEPNAYPVAVDDSARTDEDVSIEVFVLENDSDEDGDGLFVSDLEQPENGSATSDGVSIVFTPDADYCSESVQDVVHYTLQDERGATASATLFVSIACVNDAPELSATQASVSAGEVVTLDLLASASDAEGDLLSVVGIDAPSVGSLVDHGDGTITYAAPQQFSGLAVFAYEVCDNEGACAQAEVAIEVLAIAPQNGLQMLRAEVGSEPQLLSFDSPLSDPVVVCSASYSENDVPFVVRVGNVSPAGFSVRLQNPSGAPLAFEQVDCLAMNVGVLQLGQTTVEAQKYVAQAVDHDSGWNGEAQSYLAEYSSPVVLGQVMSENDADWSVFWSRGASRQAPPSASALFTGMTVAEDSDITRSPETIGFLVFEAGHGMAGNLEFEAGVTAASILGISNAPPYLSSFDASFTMSPTVGVVSQAGMNGSNGGWAQLHGSGALGFSDVALSIDEDQLADNERTHIAERVAYFVGAK